MTDRDEIEGLAGEYVLGTLAASERSAVATRRQSEPKLDAAIRFWEIRLAPLNELSPTANPPPGLLAKISRLIEFRANERSVVADLTQRVTTWRRVAMAASVAAAALVGVFGMQTFAPKPPASNLVALLQKDAATPAFLLTVNVDNRVMTVQPVAAKTEAGKSFELWLIDEDIGTPRSLGLVDNHRAVRPQLASFSRRSITRATYAVSLEPEGGSPTGQPTGPIVYTGKLIAAGDN